jgi:hypothetical protein
MTWQRIDDDTYIDDTLVTCAEYQLFIDEMREQGKYYQPDHWNSYQFPEGRAQAPILGVRYSDAISFCVWTTQRGESSGQFRLPTQKEASIYPLKFHGFGIAGYWLKNKYQFIWNGPMPSDARNISRTIDLDHAFETELNLAHARAFNRPIDVAHTININRELELELSRIVASTVDDTRDRDLKTYLARLLSENSARELGFDHSIDSAIAYEREIARNIAHALEYKFIINSNRDLTPGIDRDFSNDLDHCLDLARIFTQASDGVLVRDNDISIDISIVHYLDRVLDMYFDIFTLRERIAGRSPAFEGIRLVKERIK